MKRYVFITLKVLTSVLLVFSAAGLVSLGTGLSRDREQFEEMRAEMESVSQPLSVQNRDTGAAEASSEMTDGGTAKTAAEEKTADRNTEEYPEHTDREESAKFSGIHEETERQEGPEIIDEPESEVQLAEDQNTARFSVFTERNADFCGWIRIDGTGIDYPVMYSAEEPDFYLSRDFDKNRSKSGVPYLGKDCCLPCDNAIIYAHNMKNGTMFAGLLDYAEEDWFRRHPEIRFDTVRENGTYEVIAVFREKVHYRDETDVFRYYNYCGKLTEAEFQEYTAKIRELSLYDTGKTAEYGQQLITLSTCSYHTENGRFVVVAAEKRDGSGEN